VSESITVLLPCGVQKREYLLEAVGSIRGQTSPRWHLLVGLDPSPPPGVDEWLAAVDDPRVRRLTADRPGFAPVLNALLRAATTPFVAILLSDDRWAPHAVETLLRHRVRDPAVDFFHSARRYIDAAGRPFGDVMPSRRSFTLDDFRRQGSPVKHLMCWRRELALAIGGMNEALSPHGCDDYDFPWRMAEAGAVFRAVNECLYEYRVHDEAPRLTTHTPLQMQIATLERMFRSHGVAEDATCAYLQRAADDYLPRSHAGLASIDPQPGPPIACFREADAGAVDRFRAHGFTGRAKFFPHRLYLVPRPGPDGMQLAQEMCRVYDGATLRQAGLYAMPEAAPDVPNEVFFDDDVVWHRQQLGLAGLVANANLVLAGPRLYVTLVFSDLVQRIGRRRELKTRVENRFRGWADLLVNGIAAYARDAGLEEVWFPSAGVAMAHTDPARPVQPELFERVYDRTVRSRLVVAAVDGWWRARVGENEGRVVPLERRIEVLPAAKTICVVHDVERGLGHREAEPAFAARADREAPAALAGMLAIEAAAGVRATYCVVGLLLEELRAAIARGGHTIAFHSYEHVVPPAPPLLARLRGRLGLADESDDPVGAARAGVDFRELVRCRQVDYRTRGYRPPMSRITPGLHDRHLAYFNFDWLGSSSWYLGFERPRVENGIVKIPIHLDDFDLHRGATGWEAWERRALELVARNDFVAIGLHDCYAEHWLPHYREFLAKLAARGRLATFDEVADTTLLAGARWR